MVFKRSWLISIALALAAAAMWSFAPSLSAADANNGAGTTSSRPAQPGELPRPEARLHDQRPGSPDQASRRLWNFGREGGAKGGRTKEGGSREQAGPGEVDRQPLTATEIDEMLSFAKQHFPQLHEQLQRARQEDNRAFRQLLRKMAPPMRRMIRLWSENPQEAQTVIQLQNLEMQIREQKRQYHAAKDEQTRDLIRVTIRKGLEQRFDLRMRKLEQEIAGMRSRLDEQTRRLADQGQNKQAIIDDEFTRILEPPKASDGAKGSREQIPASQPAVEMTY